MINKGLRKILEERLEQYPEEAKEVKDFIRCILEIDENPQINNHKYTHANVESIEEDEYHNVCAVIKIYMKR